MSTKVFKELWNFGLLTFFTFANMLKVHTRFAPQNPCILLGGRGLPKLLKQVWTWKFWIFDIFLLFIIFCIFGRLTLKVNGELYKACCILRMAGRRVKRGAKVFTVYKVPLSVNCNSSSLVWCHSMQFSYSRQSCITKTAVRRAKQT